MLTGSLRKRVRLTWSALRTAYYRWQGMKIGDGCRISSTTKLDQTNPKGVHIGENTVFAFQSAVLTHDYVNARHVDTRIGSNCFIGAHVIVMPGVTIGDNVVVGAGSVVLTDIPGNCVVSGNPARIVERDIVTGRFGIRAERFLEKEGIALPTRSAPIEASAGTAAAPNDGDAIALVRQFLPHIPFALPLSDTDVDSFSLITLRAEIESRIGTTISDDDWFACHKAGDIVALVARLSGNKPMGGGGSVSAAPAGASPNTPGPVPFSRRDYEIAMPQMSRMGLSEAWLFKEMGDMHWSLITDALNTRSSEIANENGERLYATFTRICYESSIPLSEFAENEPLALEAQMSRFGAGMFLSRIDGSSTDCGIKAQMMSSFSRFGEKGNNSSLVKGQPSIPEGFAIPLLDTMPEFANDYRSVRAGEMGETIFTTDYEIVPVHDINGVGLLYFAAYPVIKDICISRHAGPDIQLFPVARDVYYFSNSGADATIAFHLTRWKIEGDLVHTTAFLVRSDERKMAEIRTTYKMVRKLAS